MWVYVSRPRISLDPLIAEAKRRARQRRLLAALLAVAMGAGIAVAAYASVAESGGGSPIPVSPVAQPLYSLRTMVVNDGSAGKPHLLACFASALMTDVPGGGCSGVPVTGYSFDRVSGLQYVDGGWQTPLLRLVGTWNDTVFNVTNASPSSASVSSPEPDCLAHKTGPTVRPSNQALTKATREVNILESMPCGHTYWFLVPAADQRTVSSLQRQFGKSILVAGWLQPVRR
jgi:hypothetical protein